MSDKILLSICIPTYNRSHYLKNCLDSITCQFNDTNIAEQIEIVVSDNASQDNTQELVKEYQARFSNIKYFRNEKNLGFDENVINSVLKARGEYCWYLGDDDLIKNGGLKFIINFLQKNKISLLTLAFRRFINIDLKEVFQEDKEINERFILYFDSHEKLISEGCFEGTLSLFIFNRNLWLKIDKQNYVKNWVYYEILFKMILLSNLKFAHLKYPAIFIGQDYEWNKNGTELFTFIHYKRLLDKLEGSGYSKNFINKELAGGISGLFTTLLQAKSNDLKCSFSNLSIIYKQFYKYPAHLLLATVIFFVPNFFIKSLKFLKKKIRNIKK